MAKKTLKYPAFPRSNFRKAKSVGLWEFYPDQTRFNEFLQVAGFALFFDAFTWVVFFHPSEMKIVGRIIIGFVFLCVAGFFTFHALKNLVRLFIVGDTYLVMESNVLAPGEGSKVQIYHNERYYINKVLVHLQCHEIVKQGKSSEIDIVCNENVFEGGKRFAKPRVPLYDFTVKIPENVPYSFHTRMKQITWALNVKLSLEDRPDMNLNFILRVGCNQLAESE